jgi:hypothetical protein
MRPSAPPVYRPQAVPKVLQRKTVTARHQGHTHPVAPPVYRPVTKKIVQPKMANTQRPPMPRSAPRAPHSTSAKQSHAGTVQMYREVKVPYNGQDPSRDAFRLRLEQRIPPGRNIATFAFRARPGKAGTDRPRITRPSTGFYEAGNNQSHSEMQIIQEITPIDEFKSPLFKEDVVHWIYTERRPCPLCRPQLEKIERSQKLRGWDGGGDSKYAPREDNLLDLTVYFSFEKEDAKHKLKQAMLQSEIAPEQLDEEEPDVETGERAVATGRGNWGTDLYFNYLFAYRDKVQEVMEFDYERMLGPGEYDTRLYDSFPAMALKVARDLVPRFEVGLNREQYEQLLVEATSRDPRAVLQ